VRHVRKSAAVGSALLFAAGMAACSGGSDASPPASPTASPATTATMLGTATPEVTPQPPASPAIDRSLMITYRHEVGSVGDMDVGEGSVWLTVTTDSLPARGELVQLDPGTVHAVRTTALADYPLRVSVGNGRAWLLMMRQVQSRHVVAVDVASGDILSETPLEGTVRGKPELSRIAVGSDGVWVTLPETTTGGNRVVRLDARSGQVVATVPLPGVPQALVTGADVWVGTVDGKLLRIDSASNTVAGETQVGQEVFDLAMDGESVWATARQADTSVELVGLDARTGNVVSRTGVPVALVAAGGGKVWVANYGFPPPAFTGYIAEFDPTTNRLVRSTSLQTALGNGVSVLAVDDGMVWALNRMTGALTGVRATA
jgi:outer membrane protein assembly factor BamB